MCTVIFEMIQDGRKKGIIQGLELGIGALIDTCQDFGCSKPDTAAKITKKFFLPPETVDRYMKKHWRG